MLIGIVGGILQGMEAVYLCKHAGYTSMVIDKNKDAPALSLADRAEVCDILKEPDARRNCSPNAMLSFPQWRTSRYWISLTEPFRNAEHTFFST